MSRLTLLDWRRQVFDLYRRVRAEAERDPAVAHGVWRAGRDELFATHPDSPVDHGSFSALPVAPYDPAFRFVVAVEDAPSVTLSVPTGTDGVVEFERIGLVQLPGLGPLDVWWIAAYGGGVFVPVKDALAGTQTYGGGRYVLDTIKGADLGSGPRGRMIVDLNFSYNPSCAYDPAWACPLAPPGNTLAEPVFAGELYLG